MTTHNEARKRYLQFEIERQKQWIHEHGGSRAGYVERYGSYKDPEHYGDGGEAIWLADSAHLHGLRAELNYFDA
jgi:hypothetical protein